ncbi:MAG: tetratricopeptide repeat protein [Polyangia bacterium]
MTAGSGTPRGLMSKYNRNKENPASSTAQADEFVGFWQRVGASIRPHARVLAVVVVVGGLLLSAGGLVVGWYERRAEGATEAWARAMRIYDNELEGDPTAKDDKDSLDKTPRYKTVKERGEATLVEIDKLPVVLRKESQLFRAGVLFDLERFDEARTAYDSATAGVTPALGAIAHEGVALCDEQNNKIDDAIAAYEKVAPKGDKATAFYRDHALMGLGRLYEKKGDKAKALDRYKELVSTLPNSPLHEDAQNRISVLEAS